MTDKATFRTVFEHQGYAIGLNDDGVFAVAVTDEADEVAFGGKVFSTLSAARTAVEAHVEYLNKKKAQPGPKKAKLSFAVLHVSGQSANIVGIDRRNGEILTRNATGAGKIDRWTTSHYHDTPLVRETLARIEKLTQEKNGLLASLRDARVSISSIGHYGINTLSEYNEKIEALEKELSRQRANWIARETGPTPAKKEVA